MAAALLTACATDRSDLACPTLVDYSPEMLAAAAAQMDALRERQLAPLITERMMPDYVKLRDQVRVCIARRGK